MIIATVIYLFKIMLQHFPALKAKLMGTGMQAVFVTTLLSQIHRMYNRVQSLKKHTKNKGKDLK
ncbi:MAG: hypothetical protein V4717_20675 [Bacteroidota bacterium]